MNTWTDGLGRINAAVLALVAQDHLGPLGHTIPVDRLAHQLLNELVPCILDSPSTVKDGGRISRILSMRQPWKHMTIVEYLQVLVGAPHTSDVMQLLAALQRQTTNEQKGYLYMQIESWAANVLYNPPKLNVALERLVFAIYNLKYDDNDEEVIDDDELLPDGNTTLPVDASRTV
jgi:hypothetical protein